MVLVRISIEKHSSGWPGLRNEYRHCLRQRLSDRFLMIQGTRRRYKIHLGSGSILMEPSDQYLCIVPDAKARQYATGIFRLRAMQFYRSS